MRRTQPKLVTRREHRAVLAQLRALEPIFHRPQYFTSRRALTQLVGADFWEVGASGRRYSRAYVMKTLAQRAGTALEDPWETSEFHCRALARGVYLLTYTLRQGERLTRRATIWERAPSGWRIVFHQGTVVEDQESNG
jgi:hypothetical protein